MTNHLVEMFIAHRVKRGEFAPSSARTARPILGQWVRFAGPTDQWTGEAAIAWVHDPALRPNSRKGRLSRLRPFSRWCVTEGHLTHDVAAMVPPVKVPPPTPRDIETGDIRALLNVCVEDRDRLIVTMMVQCGLRCVGLARAAVEDIDITRRTLAVRGKGGGGHITHTVPIPTEAWDLLATGVLSRRRAGPVIVNQRRTEPTEVSAAHLSSLVARLITAAGLKGFPYDGVSAHALRHSCAQGMLDLGADIRAVQAALGHRHQSTTELYLRRDPPGLREAMEGRVYALVS